MNIKLDKVTKEYPNGYKGLNDINIEIKQGEMVAIIGPSGAGKTTLIRSINRMIDITEGDIHVGDDVVNKLDQAELRKLRHKVGMIFQSFNLVKRQTVLTNVLSGNLAKQKGLKSLLGKFPNETKLEALSKIDQVGLLDKAYERSDKLSGGQQQRVAIARVLMQDPDIILADEPVSALDPVTKKEVLDHLTSINKELGITVIINIHDIKLAAKYCDRIIGVNKGSVVVDTPSENLDESVLEEIYEAQVKFDEE